MNDASITKVYLLSVPLESDLKHTLYFTDKASQQTYFQSTVVKTYTDFTYQRKDQIIRIPDIYDDICECNYVMYQNSRYSNKWFYAFIDKMEYISDGRTDVHIKTDVIQTWLFDYTVKSSFVEREHVNNDTIGLHTVPEELETGEYIDQVVSTSDRISWTSSIGSSFNIVAAVSEVGLNAAAPLSKVYNGVYSGLLYLTFPSANDCDNYIQAVQANLTENNIYSIFLVPSQMVANTNYFTPTGYNFQMGFVPFTNVAVSLKTDLGITDDYKLDKNYIPRNKKLLVYPYRYLVVSNNAGSFTDYRYEYFTKVNNECRFNITGAISPGCSIKLFPKNYRNADAIPYSYNNYLESLDCAKLPTCSWLNDSYTNWLTQNAVNFPLNTIKNVGQIVGGAAIAVASGGALAVGGAAIALNGVAGIFEQVKSKYEHSLVPETAKGGVNQGDLIFAEKEFYIPYKKSIKKETAQIYFKKSSFVFLVVIL